MLKRKSVVLFLSDRRVIYFLLLIYGFYVAYQLCNIHYFVSDPDNVSKDTIYSMYMSSRYDWIEQTYIQLVNGEYLSALTQRQNFSASFILVYALIPAIFNIEVWEGLLYTQYTFMVICIGIYPPLIYRLFRNKKIIIALISPFLLKHLITWAFVSYASESYWMFGWILVTSVPVFLNLCRDKWSNKSFIWIGIIIFLMSVANVFRGQGALGVLILLIIVIVFKIFREMNGNAKKLLAKKVATVLSIVIVSIFGMNFFSVTLPEAVGAITGSYGGFQYTEPWHTLYIGFNDYENRYGIYYSDTVSYNRAKEIDPEFVYESPEYYEIMRKEYFSLISDDPIYFVSSYFLKFFNGIRTFTMKYFTYGVGNTIMHPLLMILLIIAVPFVLFLLMKISILDYFKKWWYMYVIIMFSAIFSAIQPMVGIFRVDYNVGLVGAYGVSVLFILLVPLSTIFDKLYSTLSNNDKFKRIAIIFK